MGSKYKAISLAEIEDNKKQVVQLKEGVKATITAYSGEGYLEKNATINEGQNVKYSVTIENNSGSDIHNLNLVAEHSNVIFYGIEIVKMGSNEYDENGKIPIDTNWYTLKPEEENKTFKEEVLEDGTSKEFVYEFQVDNKNSNVEGNLQVSSDEFEQEIELNTLNIELI